MDSIYIFLATYFIVAPVMLIALQWALLPRGRKLRFALIALISCVLALLIAKTANQFIVQPRPFVIGNFTPLIPHAPDNGFPSDHALLGGTLAAISTYFSLRVGAVMWLLAVAIGIGRVLTGVHHTTDILGAFIIGALTVLLVTKVAARWKS